MQNENKFSGTLYRLVFHYDFRWISDIRSVFSRTGLGYNIYKQNSDYFSQPEAFII
jgi:hypothetical protein